MKSDNRLYPVILQVNFYQNSIDKIKSIDSLFRIFWGNYFSNKTSNKMPVTSLYASLLAFIFLILTIKIIRIRRANKIVLGDGDSLELQKAIRAQGNFSETVPITLILLALAENSGAPIIILQIAGFSLLLGRMLHGYGIAFIRENLRFRIAGMMLTIFSIAFLALVNLLYVIR